MMPRWSVLPAGLGETRWPGAEPYALLRAAQLQHQVNDI
jgi:hypothetical protein